MVDAARIGSTRQSLQIIFIGGVIAWALAFKIAAVFGDPIESLFTPALEPDT